MCDNILCPLIFKVSDREYHLSRMPGRTSFRCKHDLHKAPALSFSCTVAQVHVNTFTPTHMSAPSCTMKSRHDKYYPCKCVWTCLLDSCEFCHFPFKRHAVQSRIVFQFLTTLHGRSATHCVCTLFQSASQCKANKEYHNEVPCRRRPGSWWWEIGKYVG